MRGGRVKADGKSGAMEQHYAPEADRPRTQEEQDTLGREEGTKQGLTDPECVGKGRSANFALYAFSGSCSPNLAGEAFSASRVRSS